MRPTFSLETELSSKEVMRCLQQTFQQNPQEYEGQFTRDHAMISYEVSKRHFWSPWLQLECRENEGLRELFGRFSPHPSIWTGFMFSYLSIGVIVFFAAMFGVSQQLSNQSPWAYYVIPVAISIATGLWIASQFGQRLAQVEMMQLKSRVEECLRAKP
jgi:hypothetical protein